MFQETSTKVRVEREESVVWNALWPMLFLNLLRQVQVLKSKEKSSVNCKKMEYGLLKDMNISLLKLLSVKV